MGCISGKRGDKSEFNTYGILLVVTSFLMRFLTVGSFRSFGIILREFSELYDVGLGELSWIPSVNTGFMFLLGPVAGITQRKFGPRITILIGASIACIGLTASAFVSEIYFLYITYGVLTGTGFCLVSLSFIVPVNTYFRKKRILAHSLATLGAGFGLSVMPLIITTFLESYGWRGTFLMMSGVYLHCLVCGMLCNAAKKKSKSDALLSKPDETVTKPTVLEDTKDIIRNRYFVMYSIAAFTVKIAQHVPTLMIPLGMSSFGFLPTQQALVITAVGIANMAQRIVCGLFLDRIKKHAMIIMGISLILLGGATFALAFVEVYPLFVAYGVTLGTLSGLYANLQGTTLVDVIGREKYGLGLGYFRFVVGIGLAIGPPIAGLIADNTGTFYWVYFYTGSVFILGGILVVCLYILMKHEGYHSDDTIKDIAVKVENGETVELTALNSKTT